MTLYKIRHRPTGLFIRTSNCRFGRKRDQLHKKGKIWTIRPNLQAWFGTYSSNNTKLVGLYIDNKVKVFLEEEFEIVTMEFTDE